MFGDIRISYLSELHGALSSKQEGLDPVEARLQTLCIGSKSRARNGNDCIDRTI